MPFGANTLYICLLSKRGNKEKKKKAYLSLNSFWQQRGSGGPRSKSGQKLAKFSIGNVLPPSWLFDHVSHDSSLKWKKWEVCRERKKNFFCSEKKVCIRVFWTTLNSRVFFPFSLFTPTGIGNCKRLYIFEAFLKVFYTPHTEVFSMSKDM